MPVTFPSSPSFPSSGVQFPGASFPSSGVTFPSVQTPVALEFFVQPDGAVAGSPFTQQPVVRVLDGMGAVITSYTGDVTIVAGLPDGGTLSGTTVIPAVAGVASFTNLSIDTANANAFLQASINAGAISAQSDTFLVLPVFALRLQTHNGDNAPLGLYQDTACTIPATQNGDPVAGWKDVLGASGLVAIQTDSQKQPILLFVGGVPTVWYDGVDDCYSPAVAVNVTQPLTVFCVGEFPDDSPRRFFDAGSIGRCLLGSQGGGVIIEFAGSIVSVAQSFPVSAAQWTCVFNGASSKLRKNGSQVATGDTGSGDLASGVVIGVTMGLTGEFYSGSQYALLVESGADSDNLSVIEPYLESLI